MFKWGRTWKNSWRRTKFYNSFTTGLLTERYDSKQWTIHFCREKKNFFYFTKQLNSFELYGRLNTSWSKNFIVIHSILYGMYKGKFNDSPKPRVKRIFSDLGQWAAPVLNFLIDRTTSSRLFNPAFSEAYSSADTMNNSVWSWSKPKPTFPRNHTRNKRYFDGIMWKC